VKGGKCVEQNNNVRAITTAGCFSAVMLILALLSNYVPFFSFVGFFILPIPMAIIHMRFGLRWSVMMGIVVGVLMGMFLDPLTAVLQIFAFGAVGIAIGIGFQRDWAPLKMLSGVTIAMGLGLIALVGCMYVFLQVDVFQIFNDQFHQVINMVLDMNAADGGMSDIQMAQSRQQMEELARLLPAVIPLMMCMALALLSYLNIRIAQIILTRLGYAVRPFLPVRYWEISRSMLYLYVLAMVMKYWGTTRDIDWLSVVGLNLEQLSMFFIFIQGVAFMLFLLDRRFKLRTATQACVVVVMFVFPMCQIIVFIAGIFDMAFNYRKKHFTV
jgi:uncharacterized protein YybS (DUF2232 family)